MATMTARKSKTWREFDPSPAKHGLDPVELDTPRQLGAQREQLLASLPQAEEAIKVAEDALGDAELWGTSSEVSKAETTLRKAREALDQVTRRLRAIDRALAEQKIRNQELAERAMATSGGPPKPPMPTWSSRSATTCTPSPIFAARSGSSTTGCARQPATAYEPPARESGIRIGT